VGPVAWTNNGLLLSFWVGPPGPRGSQPVGRACTLLVRVGRVAFLFVRADGSRSSCAGTMGPAASWSTGARFTAPCGIKLLKQMNKN
jgi:hypothetical protein